LLSWLKSVCKVHDWRVTRIDHDRFLSDSAQLIRPTFDIAYYETLTAYWNKWRRYMQVLRVRRKRDPRRGATFHNTLFWTFLTWHARSLHWVQPFVCSKPFFSEFILDLEWFWYWGFPSSYSHLSVPHSVFQKSCIRFRIILVLRFFHINYSPSVRIVLKLLSP
jgi:hypothetical protein